MVSVPLYSVCDLLSLRRIILPGIVKLLQAIIKEQGIDLLVSNSSRTSGCPVVAGYVLFIAPNTTHRDYYLQYVRNHLPDNYPSLIVLSIKVPQLLTSSTIWSCTAERIMFSPSL